jgi:hypothetical protein
MKTSSHDLIEAKKWLRLARERARSQNVDFEIQKLREHIAEAGSALEDIGTNEEEIKNLLEALKK